MTRPWSDSVTSLILLKCCGGFIYWRRFGFVPTCRGTTAGGAMVGYEDSHLMDEPLRHVGQSS